MPLAADCQKAYRSGPCDWNNELQWKAAIHNCLGLRKTNNMWSLCPSATGLLNNIDAYRCISRTHTHKKTPNNSFHVIFDGISWNLALTVQSWPQAKGRKVETAVPHTHGATPCRCAGSRSTVCAAGFSVPAGWKDKKPEKEVLRRKKLHLVQYTHDLGILGGLTDSLVLFRLVSFQRQRPAGALHHE